VAARLLAAFFAAGALAATSQVLLLRELMVAAAGDEAALGVGFAAWLAGIAGGARLGRGRAAGSIRGAATAGLAALAVWATAAIPLGRLLRLALAPAAGEWPGLGLALAWALAVLAPAGACVGWVFAALATAAASAFGAGPGIARLYALESLGSLAGGLFASLLATQGLGSLRGALLAGLLGLALALPATWAGTLAGRAGLVAALLLLGALLALSIPLERFGERIRFAALAPGATLAASHETPYQHIALSAGEVTDVFSSGQYAGSFPDRYGSELQGQLLACLVERPARVLALGGVERGLLRVLLRHPVRELTLIEPDGRALDLVRKRLPDEDRRALDDPRVRVLQDDPRRALARGLGPFDLILLPQADPVTLLRARFTTVEFFRLCARSLAPGGVVVVSVKTAPAVLTGETAAMAGSVFGALAGTFAQVRATPGPDTLLVAGAGFTLDAAALAARWRARGVASTSFAPELLPLLLPPERMALQEAALRAAARQTPESRDDRPVSFLHALARRQQEAGSRLGRALAALGGLPPSLLVCAALLPSLLRLGRRATLATAASHAVGVVGAAGMAWSLLLLFSFQTRVGALYGQLGMLAALFMLGLATGAWALPALLSRPAGPRSSLSLSCALAAAFGASLALALPRLATPAGHGALLLAAGCVTGGLFPVAAAALLETGRGAREAAARLSTADHLGAALAALLTAVVLVPALGLAATAWLFATQVGLATLVAARAGND
jgi:predicted membrane-bound spermidine synthase